MDASELRQQWVRSSKVFAANRNRGSSGLPGVLALAGRRQTVVSAVHGVVHFRRGRRRPAEVNTASLAVVAQEFGRANALIVARADEIDDANASLHHPIRQRARELGWWAPGWQVLDVHGQSDRGPDVVLSWGGSDFAGGPGELWAYQLAQHFESVGFDVDLGGGVTGFAAAGQTMTRAAAERGATAVQLEVSRRCRTFAAGSDRERVTLFAETFIGALRATGSGSRRPG